MADPSIAERSLPLLKILAGINNTTIAEKDTVIAEKDTAITTAIADKNTAVAEKEAAEEKVEEVLKPKDGYAWVIKKTE